MENKEKIVPKDYLDITLVADVRGNEDVVVWMEKESKPAEKTYTSHINLLDKDTGEYKQFTSGGKQDMHPRLSPDGEKLAFLSTRSDKPQIHVMDLDGGESISLTSEEQGVEGFSWSPDSKHIAYISSVDPNEDKEEEEPPLTEYEAKKLELEKEYEEKEDKDPMVIDRLVYRRDVSYENPDRFKHVFVVDIDDGESRRVSDGYYHHSVPKFISNDEIISTSNREDPPDTNPIVSLVKFDIDDTHEGDILHKFDSYFEMPPVVAGDGDIILVNVFEEGNFAGQTNKWAIVKDDDHEIINLELDRNVNLIRPIDEETLLVTVDDEGKTDIRKYDVNEKSFTKLFDEEVSVVSFDGESTEEVYFAGTDPKHVWAIWKWSDSNGLELIQDPNEEDFEDKEIVEPEEFWMENPEGFEYQGWFFEAESEEGKPPLVLSIHGGPHAMWNNAGTMWHEHQCYVSEGYSVLALNPIGSQGYGEDFSQIITAKWGVDDARDLLAAVDKFSDRYDEDQLYITGGSYAGFQTANIISRDDRFKGAVAQRGVYDLITFGLTTDIPLWAQWEWKGTPWDKLEHLWEHSPVGRSKDINTPLMIIHSENDFRVPISQAEELFGALKLDDKEAVMVRYPRDGHELSRSGEPLHVVDRIQRMIDWFKAHP